MKIQQAHMVVRTRRSDGTDVDTVFILEDVNIVIPDNKLENLQTPARHHHGSSVEVHAKGYKFWSGTSGVDMPPPPPVQKQVTVRDIEITDDDFLDRIEGIQLKTEE
jgi:hypothetical protein